METSSQIINFIGFVAALACVAIIFARIAQLIIGKTDRKLRASLEIFALFCVLWIFAKPAAKFTGFEEAAEQVANAASFLWWLSLAFALDIAVRHYLWDGLLSLHGKRRVPQLVTGGVTVALYGLAIIIVLYFVYEEPIGAVLATSGAAALILGLSAQSTIKEIFAGIALNTTHALTVGDYVEIDGVYGCVHDINWRSVVVKNPHTDSLYIFPNSIVAEQKILNFCEPTDRFKYFIHFVVEPSSPPEKVIRAIGDELRYSRYVFRDPKPDFNMLGYTDRGLEIRMRFYFENDDAWWDAQNEACMAVWAAMRRHGFRIAINRMLLQAPFEWDAMNTQVACYEDGTTLRAALTANHAFGQLSPDDIATLASSAEIIDLNPPSCFFDVGGLAKGVYLVLEGQVLIVEDAKAGADLTIETCGVGQLFGIGSLLTGEPHRYRAQADQYTVAARLGGKSLDKVLSANPSVKKALKAVQSERLQRHETERVAELERLRRIRHERERKRVVDEIRRNIDRMLAKPWLHHLHDSVFSRTRHETVLKAMMASAALVCAARGPVDEAERQYIDAALKRGDLLRHVNRQHALSLFDGFAKELAADYDQGKERALATIRDVISVRHGPHLVMAVAHGVSGVHDYPTPSEQQAVAAVAACLGVSEDIGAFSLHPKETIEIQNQRRLD